MYECLFNSLQNWKASEPRAGLPPLSYFTAEWVSHVSPQVRIQGLSLESTPGMGDSL